MMDMLILKQHETGRLKRELVEKLDEESAEVYHAIASESNERQAEEIIDVIQVCVALLDLLEQEGIDIKEQVARHMFKLLERGWRYKAVLTIDITKEGDNN